MQAGNINFVSNAGARVVANRKENTYITVEVFIEDEVVDSFAFGVDDFAALHRIARKVHISAGEESPSREDVRRFCEAMHPLMIRNSVLLNQRIS